MNTLPVGAGVFWLMVVVIGVLIALVDAERGLGLLLDEQAGRLRLSVAAIGLMCSLAQAFRVRLPNPRRGIGGHVGAESTVPERRPRSGEPAERETTSISSALHVFALLVLPSALAVSTVVLAATLAGLANRRRRWYQRVFNLAQYACSVAAGAAVWQLGQARSWSEATVALWLVPTLLTYLLVNTGSVAAIVALQERLPLGYVWLRGRRALLPSYLVLLTCGALLWYLWRLGSLFPTGLVIVVGLAAIYRSCQHTVLLQQQTVDALVNLADLMDQRDYYTHQHSLRVGQYAERLAAALGHPPDECQLIFLCGRLHDIGKCTVSNEVLLKPGPLNPAERLEMARHAPVGAQMLAHFSQFKRGAAYVRAHHEWYDGGGYPDGLARSRIPLGARIIAVADAYDAMTTDRPYRTALPRAEAIRRLRAGAGQQWDPRVVVQFLELLGEPPRPAAPERGAYGKIAGMRPALHHNGLTA